MSLRRRLVVLAAAIVVVALVALAIAIAGQDKSVKTAGFPRPAGVMDHGVLLKPAAASLPVPNPTRWLGPQGRTGQFVVTCQYSHSAPDDPIVHFAMSGMSHRHDFYGSTKVDASSTAESLVDTPTTCNKTTDTAAYWQPTLYDHGKVVVPREVAAYYRPAPGVDPKTVRTMPTGLSMVTGDFTSKVPQAGDATGWACGSQSAISDTPPTCTGTAPLHLVLTFPDCWDGTYLDSVDHHSHVAYSHDGHCAKGFDVHIPQITMSVKFPILGGGHRLSLASGNIYSAHGDFFNGWDPAGLRREIDHCIHRNTVCDLASNREDSSLFQANP
jgi:hypothetical protein